MNYLGVSGSTILTDAKKFPHLFEYNMEHIEIGEFKNKYQLNRFIKMLANSLCTLGVHSPIFRGKSKYDLIEQVNYSPIEAYKNLQEDAKLAKFLGAKYLLVHFPYFGGQVQGDANQIIEEKLIDLKKLQDKYGIEIVCEPKLGAGRSKYGIEHFSSFPIDIWRKYGLKICIDLGDYVMAFGEKDMVGRIKKWQDFIGVVHLHNVDYIDNSYIWRPIHPDDVKNGYHNLESVLSYFKNLNEVYFVMEHTPEIDYNAQYLKESADYIRAHIF